jgi:MFS family permease
LPDHETLETTMNEMLRADPAARRKAIFLAMLLIAAGAALAGFLQSFTGKLGLLAETDPQRALEQGSLLLLALSAALVGVTLALAAWLYRQGSRIERAGRYPPPGARVIRDTPVVSGPGAAARGRLARWLAIGLGVVSVVVGALLVVVVRLVYGGGFA